MDFTLSVGQCRLVARNQKKIQDLFRVALQLPDVANAVGSNSASVWVEISGEKERAVKAKAYMLSLCNGNGITVRLPADILDTDLSDIELCTQAALTRIPPHELRIQGDEIVIAKAKSLLDQKHEQYKKLRDERRRLSGSDENSNTMQKDDKLETRIQDVSVDPLRVQRTSKEVNNWYPNMPYYSPQTGEQIDVVRPPRTSFTDSTSHTISSEEQIVIFPPKIQSTSSKTIEVITQPNPPSIKDSKVLRTSNGQRDLDRSPDSLISRGGSCYSPQKSALDVEPIIDPEPPIITFSNNSRTVDSIINSFPRSEDIESTISHNSLRSADTIVIPNNVRTEDSIGIPSSAISEEATLVPSNLSAEDITFSPSTQITEVDGNTTDAIQRQQSFDRSRAFETELFGKTLNDQYEQMQKLGFSRRQVDDAVQQLGPNTSADELLGVLVKRSQNRHPHAEETSAMPEQKVTDVSDSTNVEDDADNLRTIIIDGSNVAMSYGNKDVFACKGIEIVVNWFLKRGHQVIHVFVPSWRKEAPKPDSPITDQQILHKLEKLGILVFTPSRRINGRRIVCYDDRYIIKTAVDFDGIVVSNDNFRDLQNEKREFKKIVEERLLMYSFVGNQFMPPDDPLGRHGPSLDNFLRIRPTAPDHPLQPCPYDKKCTYGNKCKFYHPERQGHNQKSISQTLKEQNESRKQQNQLQLDALLEDYHPDDFKKRYNFSKHEGAHTEPIPRPPMLDQDATFKTGPLPGYRPNLESGSHGGSESGSNPHVDAVGYSAGATARPFAPYTVSGYNPHHPLPPPHVHGADQRQYYTEPLPRPQSPQVAAHGSGTVPLASFDRRNAPAPGAVQRHSSLPPDSLHEQMERLRIGSANPAHHADVGYQRYSGYPDHGRPVPYGGRGYHDSNSAPLPLPDQMRHMQNPSYHRPPPYASNYGNGNYGHSGNHAGLHYPSNPTHNQWQHTMTSLPMPSSRTGQQSLYPNLQSVINETERFPTYPNDQQRRPLDSRSAYVAPTVNPTGPSLDERRRNFLHFHKDHYTEDAILEVFAKYPNETDEHRLHQRINQYLKL